MVIILFMIDIGNETPLDRGSFPAEENMLNVCADGSPFNPKG
jgi:hypothetical protein